MIKKIIFFIGVVIVVACPEVYSNDMNGYNDYIKNAQSFESENFDVVEDTKNYESFVNKIVKTVKNTLFKDLTKNAKHLVLIIITCIISSITSAFIDTNSVKDTAKYGSVVLCGLCFISEYNNLIKSGINTVHNMADFMNISFPGIVTMLATSGYETTSLAMYNVFIFTTSIISTLAEYVFLPVIYTGMILALSNGICNSHEIHKLVKGLIKLLKYAIGITLTLFCAVLTVIGFTATSKDTLTIKTIKYAAANFVPIVGGCLSETLNGIIHSSSVLKSSVGYLGTVTIIIICLVPIVKTFFASLITKLLSVVSSILSNDILTNMLDLVCDLLIIVGAMIVLFMIMFMLLIGIAASIGG